MLTVKEIDAAEPRAKSWKLHDERGLYLEVTPTGSRRWRFKYTFNGRENRISFVGSGTGQGTSSIFLWVVLLGVFDA